MVIFLLFCSVPQKTVAAITNYTDSQVMNIRDRFENSNGDFPREGKKRERKKKIKKRMLGGIVKYIVDHPRSTLKDVAQYLKEEYKLEVSVKTIERELEEYASQTCTSWSGRRKSGQFTLIMPEGGF